jgi:predicted ABC-type transport system involved in lysophospholipase L1 biosynthesis ATPase subunit
VTPAVLDLHGIAKSYGGLRPLRIERLSVTHADRVALLGFDQPMAEVLVNLVTGAALPDRGTVTVFGRRTADIADSEEWLAVLDRFGIVSPRVVLLEGMTAIQNLALPFTLDIEPPAGESLARAEALAREVGLPEASWQHPVGKLDEVSRAYVRLARALALDPALLLLEHASASIDGVREITEFAGRLAAVSAGRRVAVVAMTADRRFAEAFSGRTLRLDPATGTLTESASRTWFRRRFA